MIRSAASVALLIVAAAAPSFAQAPKSSSAVEVSTIARGLASPWGLAILPDGRMLVTEKGGRLRIVTPQGDISEPIAGTPRVLAQGQGGLLDVVASPRFAETREIFLTFAEPDEQGLAGTAAARARLSADDRRLEGVTIIFRQQPKLSGGLHFGSRIAFARDGTLFITTGERFQFSPSQDLSGHLGKVIRINADGSIPADNPFRDRQNVRPEIWSLGHRNVQAATVHPDTGALWVAEMGPAGGDELNKPEAGRNYGWPLVSWGKHYDGRDIPDPPTRPDFADSVHQWTPVIAPSGMIVYTGAAFPDWRGSLLIGGLRAQAVVRVSLDGERFRSEERIAIGARVRDVEQGPDGAVYLITDEPNGRLMKLTPRSGAGAR